LPAIRERLEGQIAAIGLPLEPALVYLIIALVGILLLIWFWTFTLNVGMRWRRARARHLADELQLAEDLEPIQVPMGSEIEADALETGDVPLEQPAFVDKPDSERRTRLVDRVRALEATPEEVRAASRHEIAWMERGRKSLGPQLETLTQALASAREDRDRGQRLQEKREALSRELDEVRNRNETRRLACDLLQGAARRMADRFNEHLRNLVSQNLPRFTDGRYQYLQLGDDLQVRVYSNEKRSFLDLEEISSGTQRQIMLALRLALAQEQMSRIAKDRQFAFLDEPFAFFDDTRMRGALRLLPQSSEFITQHWVVAQRFPRDEFLALEIPCGSHPDTLEVGMEEVSGQQS
jgi:exonuclease SbcC